MPESPPSPAVPKESQVPRPNERMPVLPVLLEDPATALALEEAFQGALRPLQTFLLQFDTAEAQIGEAGQAWLREQIRSLMLGRVPARKGAAREILPLLGAVGGFGQVRKPKAGEAYTVATPQAEFGGRLGFFDGKDAFVPLSKLEASGLQPTEEDALRAVLSWMLWHHLSPRNYDLRICLINHAGESCEMVAMGQHPAAP